MTTEQTHTLPLALILADCLDSTPRTGLAYSAKVQAAAELRRLHEQKEHWIEQWEEVCNENQTLKNENDVLRKALFQMQEAAKALAGENT